MSQWQPVNGGGLQATQDGWRNVHDVEKSFATQPVGAGVGTQPATMSTNPYKRPKSDPRAGRCAANGQTCGAFKMKDSIYCYGHTRRLGKGEQ
jgi:hypothetical protein